MRSALICGCVLMLAAGPLGCGSSGTDTSTGASHGTTITAPAGPASTGGTSATPTSSTTTATVPASAGFTARADAVCARYQSERRDILGQLNGQFRQSGGAANAASKAAGVYRQVVASGRRELDELRGLPEPASQASAIHDYFSSAETTLDDLDGLAGALEQPGSGALRSAGPKIRADGVRSFRLAQRAGLGVCGGLR
ncbi:MAG TPA: hypothetical protein VHU24_04535 [Solirubrobacterales bacterium]|nr:hypothetical protein [Solirubrobacterales bacterium]